MKRFPVFAAVVAACLSTSVSMGAPGGGTHDPPGEAPGGGSGPERVGRAAGESGLVKAPGVVSAGSTASIRYADQFPGATVRQQIDNAINDCGIVRPCVVVIPPNVGPGAWSRSRQPHNVTVIDYRNTGGFTSSGVWSDADTQGEQICSAHAKDQDGTAEHQFTFKVDWQHLANGTSGSASLPSKEDTFGGLKVTGTDRATGRGVLQESELTKTGRGDAVALRLSNIHYGRCLDEGDECRVGISLTNEGGALVPRGEVDGTQDLGGGRSRLHWRNGSSMAWRGEWRYILNINPAKVHNKGRVARVEDTASGEQGRSRIWGSGTAWAATFGKGPRDSTADGTLQTDLCLVMEDDINKAFDLNGDGTIGPRDGLKLVAPIASVDGDDQLTIEPVAQGRATGYYGEARGVMEGGSGRYRIYKCAYVVKGGALNPSDEKPSGSRGFVDISKGATDWAAGDPWEMPPGSESWGNDITVLSRRWLPTPGQDWDLEMGNEPCDVNADGLQDCMREYGGVRIHGRYSNGILLDGDFEEFGLRMRGDQGTGIWFDQDGPRGLSTQIRWRYEDGSGDRYFRQVVDRSTGTLQMGTAGPGGGDFSVSPNGTIAVRASGTGNTGLFINNDDFDRNQEPDGDGIVVSQPAGATGRHLAITEGGTVTRFQVTGPSNAAGGRVYLGAQMGLRFEGATEDDKATDVGVEDPSAPRAITFPDASGKVVTAQGSESHGPVMWGVSTGQDRLFDTGDEVCGAAGLACAETFDLGSSGSMPCDAAHGSRFLAFCR